MSTFAPSLRALHALRRICHGPGNDALNHIRQTSTRPRSAINASLANSCRRHKSTIIEAPERATFANDPTRYDPQGRTNPEPANQGTPDPQLTSQANDNPNFLPDVSSYYTLFPQTVPSGPPRPETSTSLPTSHTLQDGPASDPPKFYINPRDLRKEFLQLQSRYHPDKFPAGTSAHQKAYALSALLNNAYKTLADPLLRAQYILQTQFDIDVTTEDSTQIKVDPETLIEVMEVQEAAEETESQEKVDELIEENKQKLRAAEAQLGALLEQGQGEDAALEAVKLKYFVTLSEALANWEPGKEVRVVHTS